MQDLLESKLKQGLFGFANNISCYDIVGMVSDDLLAQFGITSSEPESSE